MTAKELALKELKKGNTAYDAIELAIKAAKKEIFDELEKRTATYDYQKGMILFHRATWEELKKKHLQ